jgi:phospholipase/lecithinase/hemolysin
VFFAWEGGDLLNAADPQFPSATGDVNYITWTNSFAWNSLIQRIVRNASNAVERLYGKGARSIVIQNAWDLGLTPAVIQHFGTNQLRFALLRERTVKFNSDLAVSLRQLQRAKGDLRLFIYDAFAQLDEVYHNPEAYGFTKVFPSALGDEALTSKAFAGPGKDYLFWDGLHATSKFHALIAQRVQDVLDQSILEELAPTIAMDGVTLDLKRLRIGRSYTLEKSSDLRRWEDVTVFKAAIATNRWTGAETDLSSLFFRLTWRP